METLSRDVAASIPLLSERRRSAAFRHYQGILIGCMAVMSVGIPVAHFLSLHDSLMTQISMLLVFLIPKALAGFAAKAGFISETLEVKIGQCSLIFLFGIVWPLSVLLLEQREVDLHRQYLLTPSAMLMFVAHELHMRARLNLPTSPLAILVAVPHATAIIIRQFRGKGLPPDFVITTACSVFLACMGFLLHTTLVTALRDDVFKLLAALQAALTEKTQLLRAAFDATFHLDLEDEPLWSWRPHPGQLHAQHVEQQDLRSGRLRVTRSSPEMDSLCGCSMVDEVLDSIRVIHGLADLTELITRFREPEPEGVPLPNRVCIVCRDAEGFCFDCEVRAVFSGRKAVLCGLRFIGEKRPVDFKSGSGSPEKHSKTLEKISEEKPCPLQGEGSVSGLHDGKPASADSNQGLSAAVSGLKRLWEWLRADAVERPQVLKLKVSSEQRFNAFWQALTCTIDILLLRCEATTLKILQTSRAAASQLSRPLVGRSAPSLLCEGSEVRQVLRRNAKIFLTYGQQKVKEDGFHCHSFGVVRLLTSCGKVILTEAVFLLPPGPASSSLMILFNREPMAISDSGSSLSDHGLCREGLSPKDNQGLVPGGWAPGGILGRRKQSV